MKVRVVQLSQLRTGLQRLSKKASSSEIKPITETGKEKGKKKKKEERKAIDSQVMVSQGREALLEVARAC